MNITASTPQGAGIALGAAQLAFFDAEAYYGPGISPDVGKSGF